MKLRVLAAGKLKDAYFRDAAAEYCKRLGRYCKIEIREIPDEKAPPSLSPAQIEAVKSKEGGALLGLLSVPDIVIALDERGSQLSSEQLAALVDSYLTRGRSDFAFLIGGSHGLSEAVRERADVVLSLSKLTFGHQMARVILLEQLYRACKINAGETYHK